MQYVAFLRGMNVGGRRITNDELCDAFRSLDFEGVWAFIASGNVVFEAETGSRSAIARRVEEGLKASLGYEVPVFLRTAKELIGVAALDPFADVSPPLEGKLQVAFLGKKPTAAQQKKALAFATDDDLLAIEGSQLFWQPAGNLLDSELDHAGIERALGSFTVRTHRTVERLAKKLSA